MFDSKLCKSLVVWKLNVLIQYVLTGGSARHAVTISMLSWVVVANISWGEVTTQPATNFPQGTFALTLEADYAHSFNLNDTRIESGSVGVGYYFLDNISLNIQAAGFSIQQSGPDSIISELDIMVRHHVYNSGRFSLYFDFGAGVSYATRRTPAAGTYYNYILQPGVGGLYELKDHLYLMGGARYWHLSNARIEGPDRNPSSNALEGYVGLLVTF